MPAQPGEAEAALARARTVELQEIYNTCSHDPMGPLTKATVAGAAVPRHPTGKEPGAWLVTTCKVGIDNVVKVSLRQAATLPKVLGRMNATMRFVLTGALSLGAALAGLPGEYLRARAALRAGATGLALVRVPICRSPMRSGGQAVDIC